MIKECLVKKLNKLKELAKAEKEPRCLDRIRSLIAFGEGTDIKEVARINALREYVLSKNNRIVCKELSKFIKDRWAIDCDEVTVRKILIKMKLSWHKPSM